MSELLEMRDRRDSYQRDQDNATSGMGRKDSLAYRMDGGGNDERHDLDPSDWYIVKDGKMYKTSVYPRDEQEARARGYSPSREQARARADADTRSLEETATAGATNAGSVAIGPAYKNKPVKAAKNKDGTVKNAQDMDSNLLTGGSIKRR